MEHYYIQLTGGGTDGPFLLSDLSEKIASGEVDIDALVWREGWQEWKPISTILDETITDDVHRFPPSDRHPSLGEQRNKSAQISEEASMTKQQGNYILILLLIALGFPFLSILKPVTKWEYKTVEAIAQSPSSAIGGDAAKIAYKTIAPPDAQLELLGKDGWELVTCFLEIETSHPNFGSGDYVTGLQPNVRPQSAMFLFKRPKRF